MISLLSLVAVECANAEFQLSHFSEATLESNPAVTPHPVPLPKGEGTLEQAASLATASLLPVGEGQVEG
jgi:hypothetical protein